MAYTGDVTPRGPADVRELDHLTITKYAVDPEMANNCYLLQCRDTGDQLLIDAADGAESLIQLCDGALDTIVTTHQHWDHHRALAELVEWTGAATVAGAPDAEAITEQAGVPIDRTVGDGDVVAVDDPAHGALAGKFFSEVAPLAQALPVRDRRGPAVGVPLNVVDVPDWRFTERIAAVPISPHDQLP